MEAADNRHLYATKPSKTLNNWSFDNDCVERGKAGQRIPGWNWEEKSGDEKEKVSLSGFFRGTFSAFSDERTRRLITTRFS